jgi:hypothetical protein
MKKTTVSLEDLLQVKRAERPPAEFWNQFERELRAKQLAAIISPRPWWASFIRLGARASHLQLPVGAAAILALSFVAIRDSRTIEPLTLPNIDSAVAAQVNPAAYGSFGGRVGFELATPVPSVEQLDQAQIPSVAEVEASPVAVGRVAHAIPLLDSAPELDELTPSERAIAANLAAAREADPGLVDEVFGSFVRTVAVREQVRDPLARMNVPGEYRRSRLLASALPAMAGANDVAVGSSARVVRRLTEQRLYDSISRIGVQGDRVAIKF